MSKNEAEKLLVQEALSNIVESKAKTIGYLDAKTDIMTGLVEVVDSEAKMVNGVLMIPAESVSELFERCQPEY